MGGAFVGVADDATAVYWNPAGLALGGSYFSLVLDNNLGKAEPEDIGRAGRQSASIIALTAMPVGLSYYRLAATTVTPTTDPRTVQLVRLTTHHAGVTLVQSVTERFAVAADAEMGARQRGRRTRPGRGPRRSSGRRRRSARRVEPASSTRTSASWPLWARSGRASPSETSPNRISRRANGDVRVAESSDARRDFLCRCAGPDCCRRLRPGARRRLARRGPGRRRRARRPGSSSASRSGAAFASTPSATSPAAARRSTASAAASPHSGLSSSTRRSRSVPARATEAGASRRGWCTDSRLRVSGSTASRQRPRDSPRTPNPEPRTPSPEPRAPSREP